MKTKRIVPEVVQSSALDCGPASLKALLEGHGISVSYGRLREACQTDVDGTSIDTMEVVARQLGLDAEQVLIPAEHLLLPEARALPAIVVVRLPTGMTHFIVIWRVHGPFVQVMDPAVGRRFVLREKILSELYEHTMSVPASAWREWAESDDARKAFGRRVALVGASPALVDQALARDGVFPMAALEAATRCVEAMVGAKAIARGREAANLLTHLYESASREPERGLAAIPAPYWSVRPHASQSDQILARGAVLVRILGKLEPSAQSRWGWGPNDMHRISVEEKPALPPELAAAITERPERPFKALIDMLRAEGRLTPAAILLAILGASAGVTFEALLLRALMEVARELGTTGQRLAAIGLVIGFAVLLLLLDLSLLAGVLRLGRRLETRFRVLYQEKIPRLADPYFHSRLTSDMAERNHSLHFLRGFPALSERLVRSGSELVFVAAGISWLDPKSAPLAITAAILGLLLPLLTQPFLLERDLRVRSHAGGLSRFYLDALLGLVPLRTHGAARALRREHEGLLSEWVRSQVSLLRAAVLLDGVQMLAAFGVATTLLLSYLLRGGDMGPVLLLAYWSLRLPFLGQDVAQVAWSYPRLRNVALRMLEPLSAPSETAGEGAPSHSEKSEPVRIQMDDVTVRAGGHLILENLDLAITPGSHVAIVGPSGAGKSSLVGLLLGWYRPSGGRLLVDGEVLEGARLSRLRRETAWVDPAVHLWNASLLANLRYGASTDSVLPLAEVIDVAELRSVLESLPDGHQETLGEGGGLVSGGEGQRVRFGRALLRPGVKLVILDEPFRGLDHGVRARLLARARRFWKDATLLCVTHDVSETLSFDRVLVLDRGRVREDGAPESLRSGDTLYRALLESEADVARVWSDGVFRRLTLEGGKLKEVV